MTLVLLCMLLCIQSNNKCIDLHNVRISNGSIIRSKTGTPLVFTFFCNTNVFANPLLRYKMNKGGRGEVPCIEKNVTDSKNIITSERNWLTENLCLPACKAHESPIDRNCVCTPGNGLKDGKCQKCEKNKYSDGYGECKKCDGDMEQKHKKCVFKGPVKVGRIKFCLRTQYDGQTNAFDKMKVNVNSVYHDISCATGYSPIADKVKLTCHKVGQITPKLVCSKDCPNKIQNADFVDSKGNVIKVNQNKKLGDTVTLKCDYLSEPKKVEIKATCDIGGVWKLDDKCFQKKCSDESFLKKNPNSTITTAKTKKGDTYIKDDTLTYTCNKNYEAEKKSANNPLKATCKENTGWEITNLCVPRTCKNSELKLQSIKAEFVHASAKNGQTKYLESVEIKCKVKNYIFESGDGEKKAICGDGPAWGKVETCEMKGIPVWGIALIVIGSVGACSGVAIAIYYKIA